jgi:hypothetical protein
LIRRWLPIYADPDSLLTDYGAGPVPKHYDLNPRSFEDGSGWHVEAYWIGRPPERLGRFATYSEANDWIVLESATYLYFANSSDGPEGLAKPQSSSFNLAQANHLVHRSPNAAMASSRLAVRPVKAYPSTPSGTPFRAQSHCVSGWSETFRL